MQEDFSKFQEKRKKRTGTNAGRKLKNGLAAGQALTSDDLLVEDRGKTSERK